jgi:hypothetical protein
MQGGRTGAQGSNKLLGKKFSKVLNITTFYTLILIRALTFEKLCQEIRALLRHLRVWAPAQCQTLPVPTSNLVIVFSIIVGFRFRVKV